MTDIEFRKKQTIAKHLTEGFEPETSRMVMLCLIQEYLKEKSQIHRRMFDRIKEFLPRPSCEFVDVKTKVKNDEAEALAPFQSVVTAQELNMVFLDTGVTLKPLYIRYCEFFDMLEKSGGKKDSYYHFLDFFYSKVECPDENCAYFRISQKHYNYFRRTYKEFLNKLKEEEKEFYTKNGYFAASSQINSIKRKNENYLCKISEEERNKKLSFRFTDSDWIEIIG